MPNLQPGQRVATPPSDRLRLTLGGEGAGTASIKMHVDSTFSTRPKDGRASGRDVIVEADEEAQGVVQIVSAVPGRPILGRLSLHVASIPVRESQHTRSKRRWEVAGLELEGRTAVEVLRLAKDTHKVWTLQSMVETADHFENESLREHKSQPVAVATSAARVAWGDRERVAVGFDVMVDRSASMAWAYQPGGVLEVLRQGVVAAGKAALDGAQPIRWFSFGAPAEAKSARVRLASSDGGVDLIESLRPDLFSSGARLDLTLLEQLNLRPVMLVTDSFSYVSDVVEGFEAGLVSSLVVVGPAEDDELIPAEERAAHKALNDARVAVLLLPEESSLGTGQADSRVDAVAEFVLERFAEIAASEMESNHGPNA